MIVHAYYPLGETRVQREVDALLERGYHVDVLCLRDRGERRHEHVGAVQIVRLPVRRHRSWGLAGQLIEYLAFFLAVLVTFTVRHRRRRYDAVQVHNLPDLLVFAAVAARRTRTPILLDLHDLMPEFFASRTGREMHHPLVRIMAWQEQRACAFADHVITVTDGWRETLVARGVPREKVSVVMNLADTRIFGRDISRRREQGGRLELLYHGTLTHRYGLDLLLRAVAALVQDVRAVHLTLHGRGEAMEDLQRLAADLGLGSHVTFSTDLIATESLPELIAGADVGVVPYRSDVFTDGILPTKLLEYVATGVPVIASRTPCVSTYFDSSMVELVTPGDIEELTSAIRSLRDDPRRRAELAENARAFEDRHTWGRMSAEYAHLVQRLRSGHRGMPPTAGSGRDARQRAGRADGRPRHDRAATG